MRFGLEGFWAFKASAFSGDFWKISIGPPFALFRKMRVLGDVA